MDQSSDLTFLPAIAALAVGILATLAAFVFVGVVVGVIVLLACVVLGGAMCARFVRRNEVS